MTPVSFAEHVIVVAKDQPEYLPLPAHVIADDPQGVITCCWEMTWRERLAVLWRGRVWHQIFTFGNRLQPQILRVDKPDFPRCPHGKLIGGLRLQIGEGCAACIATVTKALATKP